MKLFGQIVRTVVNVAVLPVTVVHDAFAALPEAGDKTPGSRIRKQIQKIKDDAEEERT